MTEAECLHVQSWVRSLTDQELAGLLNQARAERDLWRWLDRKPVKQEAAFLELLEALAATESPEE